LREVFTSPDLVSSLFRAAAWGVKGQCREDHHFRPQGWRDEEVWLDAARLLGGQPHGQGLPQERRQAGRRGEQRLLPREGDSPAFCQSFAK
ncbi:unnamed protein product, partial [Effrenium voratum]